MRGLFDGEYEIKFLVDGCYRISGYMPIEDSDKMSFCNILEIKGFAKPLKKIKSEVSVFDYTNEVTTNIIEGSSTTTSYTDLTKITKISNFKSLNRSRLTFGMSEEDKSSAAGKNISNE